MKKYIIAVTECKTYWYDVEAENDNEAIDKGEELWNSGVTAKRESDLSFDNSYIDEVEIK